MTNKEYMSRAYEINRRLNSRRRRLEYLKSRIGSTNQNMDGMPKASPPSSSHMEELAVRILDIERSIEQDEQALADARSEISESIKGINNENLCTILQMRYLDYMQWEDIMASMDYCRSYLYELHGRALRMIRQKP